MILATPSCWLSERIAEVLRCFGRSDRSYVDAMIECGEQLMESANGELTGSQSYSISNRVTEGKRESLC